MDRSMIEWKISQIELMIEAEEDQNIGGYAARLSHWSGKPKTINIEIGEMKALIEYYKKELEKCENSEVGKK